MNPAVPVEIVRADAVRLLLGVIFGACGVAACFLWLQTAGRRRLSLLYFGLAALMYGVRLIVTTATAGYLAPQHTGLLQRMDWVITSFIVLPFILFFVETVTPQWKKAARWIVAVTLVLQILILTARLLNLRRNLADTANSLMVLVLMPLLLLMLFLPRRKANRELWIVRAGVIVFAAFAAYTNAVAVHLIAGNSQAEFVGFAIFLCCLGYVAASQTFHNEERLISISKELEIARRIQAGLGWSRNPAERDRQRPDSALRHIRAPSGSEAVRARAPLRPCFQGRPSLRLRARQRQDPGFYQTREVREQFLRASLDAISRSELRRDLGP